MAEDEKTRQWFTDQEAAEAARRAARPREAPERHREYGDAQTVRAQSLDDRVRARLERQAREMHEVTAKHAGLGGVVRRIIGRGPSAEQERQQLEQQHRREIAGVVRNGAALDDFHQRARVCAGLRSLAEEKQERKQAEARRRFFRQSQSTLPKDRGRER